MAGCVRSNAGTREPRFTTVESQDAHDRRAPRGLPLLLRVERTSPPAVGVVDPARGRPLHVAHLRRHAAADALLPRTRAATGAADDDDAEVLPYARHRRGRQRRPTPDLLRDARQLLVRAVLQ